MAAATSIITEQSPYIVRRVSPPLRRPFRSPNGRRRTTSSGRDHRVRLCAGDRHRKAFSETFTKAGGQVENLRVPLANPDFSPFLQKVADAKPDALRRPRGVGAQFMKQFVERGLDRSGIRFLAEGSVTDDDLLNGMGDVALGAITTHYSAGTTAPRTRPSWKPSRRPTTACGRTSWRSAAMTACT